MLRLSNPAHSTNPEMSFPTSCCDSERQSRIFERDRGTLNEIYATLNVIASHMNEMTQLILNEIMKFQNSSHATSE